MMSGVLLFVIFLSGVSAVPPLPADATSAAVTLWLENAMKKVADSLPTDTRHQAKNTINSDLQVSNSVQYGDMKKSAAHVTVDDSKNAANILPLDATRNAVVSQVKSSATSTIPSEVGHKISSGFNSAAVSKDGMQKAVTNFPQNVQQKTTSAIPPDAVARYGNVPPVATTKVEKAYYPGVNSGMEKSSSATRKASSDVLPDTAPKVANPLQQNAETTAAKNVATVPSNTSNALVSDAANMNHSLQNVKGQKALTSSPLDVRRKSTNTLLSIGTQTAPTELLIAPDDKHTDKVQNAVIGPQSNLQISEVSKLPNIPTQDPVHGSTMKDTKGLKINMASNDTKNAVNVKAVVGVMPSIVQKEFKSLPKSTNQQTAKKSAFDRFISGMVRTLCWSCSSNAKQTNRGINAPPGYVWGF